jgi:hypothetical protein
MFSNVSFLKFQNFKIWSGLLSFVSILAGAVIKFSILIHVFIFSISSFFNGNLLST